MLEQNVSLYSVLNQRFGSRLQPQLQRKATLATLSHAIEDVVLHNNLEPVVFVAFQNERYYRQEQVRYDQIRIQARNLTVYGKNISEKVTYDRDWFVVVNEPRFKVVMASYELDPVLEETHLPEVQNEAYRPFLGIWSYDNEVVDFACRYLAQQEPASVSRAVEEVISLPQSTPEQVRLISNISDRILLKMEKTNRHALHQINHNHQLLLDLEHQAGMLEQVDLAKQMAETERNNLHTELKRLYNELTRSQTVMTQAIVNKARLEQAVETSKSMLQQLHLQLEELAGASSAEQGQQVLETVKKIQLLLNQSEN